MTNFNDDKIWIHACKIDDVPENSGICLKYMGKQIALFNFTSYGKWFAAQNMCPHKNQFVLSRGILGDKNNEPKIACPLHKKTFSLINGKNLEGEDYEIEIYPVKIVNQSIYIGIPQKVKY
ncbi:nitrite reductase small subunit NirD [Rosettibacter firmus]|uniref:nitrite reductase small subunit NirD n=1 Tax=Rosettibacter firmus TaxID=3111522 RepID=UPI00336C1BF4